MNKHLVTVVLLLFASKASAADFVHGLTAYNSGDFATAARAFRVLAEEGDPAPQFFLGLMFANGQGVPRDYAEASRWYRKAAEQGHVDAQTNLGQMYADGQGVPHDIVTACAWWSVAAYGGSNFAAMSLQLFEPQLTFRQRTQALDMARAILSKYRRE